MSKGKSKRNILTDLNRTLELSKELLEAGASFIDRIQPAKPPPGGSPPSAPAPTKLTPYEFMGLPPDRSRRDFNKRYRELSSLYHPDKGSGSDAMMKRLNEYWDEIKKEKGWG